MPFKKNNSNNISNNNPSKQSIIAIILSMTTGAHQESTSRGYWILLHICGVRTSLCVHVAVSLVFSPSSRRPRPRHRPPTRRRWPPTRCSKCNVPSLPSHLLPLHTCSVPMSLIPCRACVVSLDRSGGPHPFFGGLCFVSSLPCSDFICWKMLCKMEECFGI